VKDRFARIGRHDLKAPCLLAKNPAETGAIMP
jgi:hypothetical protein